MVGAAYTALAFYAFRRLFRLGSSGEIREDALQILLRFPYAEIIIYLIAVGVLLAGVNALYAGFTNAHMRDVDELALSTAKEKWFNFTGRVGLAGVAAVYFIMAYSLHQVARLSQADKFRGVGESFSYLEGWGWGLIMMLITGTGLFAYGMFMFIVATYGRKPV